MKISWFLLAIPLLASACCTQQHKTNRQENSKDSTMVSGKPTDSLPVCIQQKIDSIKALPKWNPPAEVNEYAYQGKQVFLFSSDCCDQFNMLYDDNCHPICAPSGGFTGRGDRKCPDFDKEAKLIRLVWKDPR